MQPCRHHLGVVHDEHISVPKKLRQVAHDGIVRQLGTPVHQQASRVARLDGDLSDQFFRQVVIDVADLHYAPNRR